MSAALFRRGPAKWRSRQLYARLSLPPMNQPATGGFQSRTWFHGSNQCSSLATSAQNPSGSFSARAYSASYSAIDLHRAWLENSCAGLKTRVSLRTDSISAMEDL